MLNLHAILYFLFFCFSFQLIAGCKHSKSPYPSLKSQRATLTNKKTVNPIRILDSTALVHDLIFLSSDSCEGRLPGTAGHELALEEIVQRMREIGLDSFDGSLKKGFRRPFNRKNVNANNIIGFLKGKTKPDQFIVISAHYDHIGRINDRIYNGASDNASGTACLLAIAEYFKMNPQQYSLVFAAFDMEEEGMKGSQEFVDNLPPGIAISQIHLNLNIDMIVRNDSNELFVCGIKHYPSLKYLIDEVQPLTSTKLLMGHDWGEQREDWTNLSDHWAFHKKQIPFLYFGTEDHIDYHRPTDIWQKIDLHEFIENCNLIAELVKHIK